MFRGLALALVLGTAVLAQGGGKGLTMGPETALLIVDIQNFYFEGGLVPLTGSVEAGAQARRVLEAFRAKRLPVIHVRHVPAKVAIVDVSGCSSKASVTCSRNRGSVTRTSSSSRTERDTTSAPSPSA